MAEIDVVVPVYKVEQYLRRCVDSLLAQTFRDFRIILVDDGSPDDCGSICDAYSEKHDCIYVIHQENGGLSAARNAGIAFALSGEESGWITLVDSDDWVHPEYLACLYHAAINSNTDIAVTEYMETYGEGFSDVQKKTRVLHPDELYLEKPVLATVAWGKLYRKHFFADLRYPEGKIHEDEFTTYRLLFSVDRITVVNGPLYAYFINEEGIIRRKWTPQRMDALEALEEQIVFFKDRDYPEIARSRFKAWLNLNRKIQIEIKGYNGYSTSQKEIEIKKLKHRMRQMIKKYKAQNWISVKNRGDDLWAYSNAYPVFGFMHKMYRFILRRDQD